MEIQLLKKWKGRPKRTKMIVSKEAGLKLEKEGIAICLNEKGTDVVEIIIDEEE